MAYIPSKCSISDYEQVVYNGETKNKLYISFGGNELIDADHYCEKLTIKSRLLKNGNNYFSLDNFVSKEATLILHKIEIGKIKGPVIIELGTYIDKVQDYVYIPFGVFNIQGTPTNDKDKTTITLRDNSVNFDFDYNAKNEIDRNGGSATLYQILQDICKQAKVNCTVPSTLTGIDDKTGLYDNSIKARTYVSYIAEHCGKIATIDRNGYLIFVDLIGDAINLSGNNISIDNAIERPIETIQIDGKSTQATSTNPVSPSPDYPSEIECVKGKNLLDYITIRIYAGTTVNNLVFKPMIEKGTQATNYEPYQENTLNIDLQGNELCSLPDNVKDELVIENGRAKIIKRVGKYNITGNEAWALSGTESQPYINFSNYVDNCKYPATTTELPNLLSNYYLQITRNNLYDGRITLSPSKALIIYDTVHNTSLANFKEWLKSAYVVVYYQLATPTEIDLGEVETLSTFKGVNNVSLDASMQTNINLQYYKSKQTYTVPLNIVQSYEDGEDFKLSQVKYESGELYWNKGDNKNDTLYINSANPYITNQKNIDNIYNIVNGLEINSLKLKKQRGNPLLDCYDFIEIQTDNSNGLAKCGLFKNGIMKSMSSNAITYKTLAQNELTYNGKIMQTFDTTITKQAKTTNVSKNNEASLKKYIKSEIDGVKGELTTVVGKVDTIDVKTNNNYQEILNMFDEYTPQSDFLELENNVTRIQTDTYTKTEINQKLTNGSVTKVLTTAGTFDNNGLTIEKTNAKTKGNFNEKGMTIKDATGSTDTELLFAGYDDILNETIVRTKNIKVEKYLTIGKNSRIEDYSNGTGVFHIGE